MSNDPQSIKTALEDLKQEIKKNPVPRHSGTELDAEEICRLVCALDCLSRYYQHSTMTEPSFITATTTTQHGLAEIISPSFGKGRLEENPLHVSNSRNSFREPLDALVNLRLLEGFVRRGKGGRAGKAYRVSEKGQALLSEWDADSQRRAMINDVLCSIPGKLSREEYWKKHPPEDEARITLITRTNGSNKIRASRSPSKAEKRLAKASNYTTPDDLQDAADRLYTAGEDVPFTEAQINTRQEKMDEFATYLVVAEVISGQPASTEWNSESLQNAVYAKFQSGIAFISDGDATYLCSPTGLDRAIKWVSARYGAVHGDTYLFTAHEQLQDDLTAAIKSLNESLRYVSKSTVRAHHYSVSSSREEQRGID